MILELPTEIEQRVRRAAEARGLSESEYIVATMSGQFGDESGARVSDSEASLLREIDRGFSDAWWEHYRALIDRRDAGGLHGEESRELRALSDTLEEYNVRRIACIAGVARRHGRALPELMDELGLQPRAVA